jgi:DNA-binding NarL/FixJ family response regulator
LEKIKVLLADDQEIITRGLKMILESGDEIIVTGTAGNGEEAYNLCKWQRPDVVLMDIKMPVMSGVEATAAITRDFPGVKIIILTTFNEEGYIFDALAGGAFGYLLKESTPEEIITAVKTVYRGGALLQSGVADKVVRRFSLSGGKETGRLAADERVNLLTEREKDIARLVGEGRSNREIAGELYLSQGTVRNHLSSILAKTGLRDRTQLAIFAIKNNLVS